MPHQPWHRPPPLPPYGSPLFGGAVGRALGAQAPPGLISPGQFVQELDQGPPMTDRPPQMMDPAKPPPREYVPNIPRGFAGPIHPTDPERDPAQLDWEMMKMSDGTSQLVEPLREKEPGRQLNWGALNTLATGGAIPGVEAPTLNLGFGRGSGGVDQIIARNAAVDWEEFQRRQQQGMGVYGGPNV